MLLGKVKSRVVSTAKSDRIPNEQLLSVEPLDRFGKKGTGWICIDSVQSGPGDTVLVLQEGTGAREALNLGSQPLPAQMVIVGVVDSVQE